MVVGTFILMINQSLYECEDIVDNHHLYVRTDFLVYIIIQTMNMNTNYFIKSLTVSNL